MSLHPQQGQSEQQTGQQVGQSPPADPTTRPITLKTIARMVREGEPFACLTAYDATTARLMERAGVHVLLAGDSGAQVMLGYERTTDMPLEVSIAMTAAIKRGAPHTVIMADMPFMSYQADDAEGLRNAGRFMREGMADIVKIEVDASFAPLVRKMARAGVPVCAHIGLLPQSSAITGGYVAPGRTAESAAEIVEAAVELERAGAVMLLIEAVPEEVTEAVVAATRVPVIGIGAGPAAHGQILVIHDILGLSEHPPRFAEPIASLAGEYIEAGRTWVARVAKKEIGGQRYSMRPGEADKLPGVLRRGEAAQGG